MAITVVGAGVDTTPISKDYKYEYPLDLKLHPDGPLHKKLVSEILTRAQNSRTAMSSRYASWRKIDRNLTAYIPKTEEERLIQAVDNRRPVALVVPMTFAIKETILTQLASIFFEDIFFPYEGVGPEDTVGAILLQHHIQQQCLRSKAELALFTQWGDGLTYGFGVAAPVWEKKYGFRTEVAETGFFDFFGFRKTGEKRTRVREIVWEGNRIKNIDPYRYWPDPNVPCHAVQDGEFVTWLASENEMDLLARETSVVEGLFNCKYLQYAGGRSSLSQEESGRGDRNDSVSRPSVSQSVTNPIDVIYAYIKLIPKRWKLGSSEQPDIWMFALANDRVIIKAQPLNLNHNMFPVAVCAPDFDGYSLSPTSRLEVIYPLQMTVDRLVNTHFANIAKTMNGMFVIDPYRINMGDMLTPGPGKIIRLRRASWGQGVQGALEQLPVTDVTRGHLPDTAYITELMQRVTSATDPLQGMFGDAPERRTKAEYQGTRGSAVARLAKTARLIYAMSMRDLGHMMASHTAQLLSQESFVKLSGDWPQILAEEYGLGDRIKDNRIKIKPSDLNVNYDIVPITGRISSADDPDSMIRLFETVVKHPTLSARLDVVRMFLSLARRLGERNVNDFKVKVNALPDEQVQNMAADGELVAV